jgi:hypothetical protein
MYSVFRILKNENLNLFYDKKTTANKSYNQWRVDV